jgi:hypothetical protein
VVLDYSRADTFLEVLPPVGRVVDLLVTFTPGTSTVAAEAFFVPSYQAAARSQLAVRQGGETLGTEASCDFPSEISCLGGASPNEEVSVRLRHPGATDQQVALYLSWG